MTSDKINNLLLWGREKLLQEQMKAITQRSPHAQSVERSLQIPKLKENSLQITTKELVNEGECLILAALDLLIQASHALQRHKTSEAESHLVSVQIKESIRECEKEIANARAILIQLKEKKPSELTSEGRIL